MVTDKLGIPCWFTLLIDNTPIIKAQMPVFYGIDVHNAVTLVLAAECCDIYNQAGCQ